MTTHAYTDFTGGEAGDLGADGCKENQFQGRNVMVFQDGTVGPRPGVKVLAPSGVSGYAGIGMVRGTGATETNGIVYLQGVNVRGFTFSPLGSVAVLGTVSITAVTIPQLIQAGPGRAILPQYSNQVYEIVTATPTVAAIPSSPGALVATLYGSRLITARTTGNPKRVYYSAAITTTAISSIAWPALNFFDVGLPDWPIVGVDEVRQRLSITNEGGEFWALSGTPGVNDVLRRQPRGDLSPVAWYNSARVGETLWFLPLSEDFPVSFSGSIPDKLRYRYLRFTGGSITAATSFFAAALPSIDCVLFFEVAGSNRALMRLNGAFTYHTFGTLTNYATPVSVGGSSTDIDMPMLLCSAGSAGSTAAFYVFNPQLDRPGKVGDTYAMPGDNSSTPVTAHIYTSLLASKQDHDIRVKTVTVEGFTWNTASASNNHYDLTVRSLFRYGPTAYKDSKTYSDDWTPGSVVADKTDRRIRFTGVDAQPGHKVQIRLDNIRGFAVKDIIVDYDEVPRR